MSARIFQDHYRKKWKKESFYEVVISQQVAFISCPKNLGKTSKLIQWDVT